MEQTAAYERLKAVIPIHPADSTKYNIDNIFTDDDSCGDTDYDSGDADEAL